jgi:hypothetical protein
MVDVADVEKAERLGRRRSRIMMVQALLFVSWQGLFFSGRAEDTIRTVTQVKISAWMVWAVALLVLLATGGGLVRGRKVRALLDDELTRSHRTQAYVYGFWAAMGSALGLYAISLFEPVSARETIHIILSAGIGTALLLFAALDWRSQRMTG